MFGNLLHKDLEAFVRDWNNHPIRKNHTVDTPHGRPIDIYDMPDLYGMSAALSLVSLVTMFCFKAQKTSYNPLIVACGQRVC